MAAGISITTTQLVINSTALFRVPTGSVAVWCIERAAELRFQARRHAPPNRSYARRRPTWATGRLLTTIGGRAAQHDAHSIDIYLWCSAPYAQYVLKGTASQGRHYIYSTRGWGQKDLVREWVRKDQFSASKVEKGFYMTLVDVPFKNKFVLRVRGQVPNPFLSDGYDVVQRKHEALPKIEFALEGGANFNR